MSKGNDVPSYSLDHVRNIGIAAHVDAGKTTLTERVLFYTGASHRMGGVDEGNTRTDWMAEEQEHGITITSAVTQCPWKDHLIQIVDTPGHVDFTIEVERSMRVLDGAIIVMDGVRGVEPQTETVWRQANKFDVPRAVFVNKMDKPGADFLRALETITKRFGDETVPVCVPLADSHFVLHLIEQKVYEFSGDKGKDVTVRDPVGTEIDDMAEWRETMLLALGNHIEEIGDKVLMEEEISEDEAWNAVRVLTQNGTIRPAFGGSALRNWGVQPVLDAVIKIMPNPTEVEPSVGRNPEGEEVLVEMNDDEPLVALAFKVQLFDGRRHVFVRVYRGILEAGMMIKVAGSEVTERVARVFEVDADKKTRLNRATSGQIVLLAGLRFVTTGDTICDVEHPVLLERIDARQPVLGLAIEPESSKDEEKLVEVLKKVTQEDPTLRYEEDPETGQRILSGMGELHLQINFERMQREFGLKLRAGRPRVVHRETVGGSATHTGGVDRVIEAGNHRIELKAQVTVKVEPLPRGGGVEVVCSPTWNPSDFTPAVDQVEAVESGTNDALSGGPIEGAALEDVRVEVLSVETFGSASSVQALRIAAASAVRDALKAAGGRILQPVMKVEVVVPDESTGGVLGDLQARGANILGHEASAGNTTISAEAGLSSLIGYMTDLRSSTKGRGQFVMEFDRFDVL